MPSKLPFLIVCCLSILAVPCASATVGNAGPMLEYRNEKYGFTMKVPADQFVAGTARNPEIGALWISRDKLARLLAVAAPNETGGASETHRELVIGETYRN